MAICLSFITLLLGVIASVLALLLLRSTGNEQLSLWKNGEEEKAFGGDKDPRASLSRARRSSPPVKDDIIQIRAEEPCGQSASKAQLGKLLDLSQEIDENVDKLWDRIAGKDYLDIDFACPKAYRTIGPDYGAEGQFQLVMICTIDEFF